MVNPSEHQEEKSKKEGLRCGNIPEEGKFAGEPCKALLLENDTELGIGVRCGRCGKFTSLEEINIRAAELQKETRRKKMAHAPVGVRDIEGEKKSMFHTFELLKCHGYLYGAGDLKEVRYHFTYDGSDCEVDRVEGETRTIIPTYHPNVKITRRLENELPLRIEFIFKKRGVSLVLKI